jgi:GT2 family glycosyltransferase
MGNRNAGPGDIDIVVPCGRPDTAAARNTIETLSKVATSHGSRVLVVGHGVSHQLGQDAPDCLTLIDTATPVWPAEARNLGARQSRADILVFVDDDCIPEDGLLEKVQQRFCAHPELGVISGQIASGEVTYVTLTHDFACFGFQQAHREKWDTPLLVSAFMAVRRDLFEQLAGFDENLQIREDVDLVLRALAAGYRSLYTPDIKVLHFHDRNTWARLLAYQFRNGRHPYTMERKARLLLKYRLKAMVRPLLPLLFPLFLAKTAFNVVRENLGTRTDLVKVLPGVVAGLLAYELGRVSSILAPSR